MTAPSISNAVPWQRQLPRSTGPSFCRPTKDSNATSVAGTATAASRRADPFPGRQAMQDWVEPLVGAVVLAITLLDVFLTVLYARAGAGLIAPWLARGVWRVFRALS